MKRKLATLLLFATLCAPAFGQGCAMCYTGAEAAGAKSQKALDHGVLILMVTVMSFVGAFAVIAYKYRNPRQESGNAE